MKNSLIDLNNHLFAEMERLGDEDLTGDDTALVEKGKTMSEMAMKYEDWLRGCVHHDGRKGNVYLPCYMVLAIADWIEAHRDVAPVRHGRWVFNQDEMSLHCSYCDEVFRFEDAEKDECLDFMEYAKYCLACGTRMDGEDDDD